MKVHLLQKRRVTAGTTALFLGLSLLSTVPAKAETSDLAGTNRIDTAVKIAEASWNGKWAGSTNAVLAAANNENLVDALAVAPLAYAVKAPILLSFKGDTVDSATLTELKKRSIRNVYLASGAGVITDKAKAQLEAQGMKVTRLGGTNRYETAKNISDELKKVGVESKAVAVVNGKVGLADALSVASVAAQQGMTIALASDKDTAPADMDITGKTVYAVGGAGVLSDELVQKLGAKRLGGDTRFETNAEVIKNLKDVVDFSKIYLADGDNKHLIDSLTGSVYAAQTKSIIVLAGQRLSSLQSTTLSENFTKDTKVILLGGSVSGAAQAAALSIAGDKLQQATKPLLFETVTAVNSRTLQIKLTNPEIIADPAQFTVKDALGNPVAITSLKNAPWDAKNKTVIAELQQDTAPGSLYSLTSGNVTRHFGGRAVDTIKPYTVKGGIVSSAYNKVKIQFSESVNITGMKVAITQSNGEKAVLPVYKINYMNGDGSLVEVTTGEQSDAALYTISIDGATDLAGQAMDKEDSQSFAGSKKDDTPVSILGAAAVDYNQVLIRTDIELNPDTVIPGNFNITASNGGTHIPVTAARLATSEDLDETGNFISQENADKYILLTVGSLSDSTIYAVTASNLQSSANIGMSTAVSASFTGKMKPTGNLDFGTEPVVAVNNTTILVCFDKQVTKETAENLANYSIRKTYGDKAPLAVKSAFLQSDKKNVKLTTEPLTDGGLYTILISNVSDIYGRTLKIDGISNTAAFVGRKTADPITAVNVTASNDTTVTLHFNQMAGASANDIAHYFISDGVGYPLSAEIQSNGSDVMLTIPKTVEDKIYTVTVKDLENIDGVPMSTAGLTCTMVGSGIGTTMPKLQMVVPVDSQTIKLFFDRDVTDALLKDKIYDASTMKIKQINGKDILQFKRNNGTDVYGNRLGNHKVWQDPYNSNILVIRTDGSFTFTRGTDYTTMNIQGNSAYLDGNSSEYTFAALDPSSTPQGPKMLSAVALDGKTIQVNFDQAVTDVDASDFILAASQDGTQITGITLGAPVQIDEKTYKLPLTSGTLANSIYYLRVVSSEQADTNATVNKIKDKSGFVELTATAASTTAPDYAFAQFAGTTVLPSSITGVTVLASSEKTIEVTFPQAMDIVSASDKSNYFIYSNAAGTTISAVQPRAVIYDGVLNKAVLYLEERLPDSTNNLYYLGIKGDHTLKSGILNDTKTAGIDDSIALTTLGYGIIKPFGAAKSPAPKPEITSVIPSSDNTRLIVTFKQAVAFGSLPASLVYKSTGSIASNEFQLSSGSGTFGTINAQTYFILTTENGVQMLQATRLSNTTLEIILDRPLSPGTAVEFSINPAQIQQGNIDTIFTMTKDMVDISSNHQKLSFAAKRPVADNTKPVIASAVGNSRGVTITFNENMDGSKLIEENFIDSLTDGAVLRIGEPYDAVSRSIVLVFSKDVNYGDYIALSKVISDTAGNLLDEKTQKIMWNGSAWLIK